MSSVDAHVEIEQIPGRRLGRRPHDPARQLLKLGPTLTGIVPQHPVAADHASMVSDWGLYQNDRFGVCGPTAVANYTKLVTKALGDGEVSPSQEDVFALYRLCNPDFDPATGAGDNGVDMATMLDFLVKVGIGGKKALAYAAVDTSNLDEVRAAISLFGGVLFGLDLEVAQQTQTDNGLWDYQPSNQWGGHATLGVLYTSDARAGHEDFGNITWAELIGFTDQFAVHQAPQAFVVIYPEHLGSKTFQQGVNVAQLGASYTALTGRPFPGGIPGPSPTPEPPAPAVDPADEALVATLGPWLSEHHTGDNKRAATAVRTWMATKGLS